MNQLDLSIQYCMKNFGEKAAKDFLINVMEYSDVVVIFRYGQAT